MTRPEQPAPGEDTAASAQDNAPVEGAGEAGDVDPRKPSEDASDMVPSTPEPLEPPG